MSSFLVMHNVLLLPACTMNPSLVVCVSLLAEHVQVGYFTAS